MATATKILDQYVRDSRYGTSSDVPQAGNQQRKKDGRISNGGTASAAKAVYKGPDLKKSFDRM